MSNINNPHDEFFKALMQDKAMAISYFQYFLPQPIVQHLNFDTLELDTNSYITEELKERYSDIVFTCQFKDYPVYLPFLLEHKSTPSEYPHLQLLRYMLEIWEQCLKTQKGLSPILPIIFYHGEKKWHYRPFEAYFDWMDDDLKPYIPNFEYVLNDLSGHSKLDLMKIKVRFFINALLALKYKGNFVLLKQEVRFESMNIEVMETKLFRQLLVYVLGNTQAEQTEVNQFIEQLIELPKTEEAMTMYDQFLQLADKELYKSYEQLNSSLALERQRVREAQEKAEQARLLAKEAEKREQEARKLVVSERLRAQEERLKAEEDRLRAQEAYEQEQIALRLVVEEEKLRAEEEKLRAQEEKLRAEEEHQKFINSIQVMLKAGLSVEFIANALEFDLVFIQEIAQGTY